MGINNGTIHHCIDYCPLHNINVFSRCWCVHLIISSGSHYLPRLPWMCNLVHIQGETHHSCCHCEYLVPFSGMANARVCVCVLGHHSGHIPKTSTSMFSIGPGLKRLLDNNYSSSQSGWKNFILLCLLPVIHPCGFLNVCGARKGECSLGMAPIQLCKIGLVLNGVHEFLPVVQWEA